MTSMRYAIEVDTPGRGVRRTVDTALIDDLPNARRLELDHIVDQALAHVAEHHRGAAPTVLLAELLLTITDTEAYERECQRRGLMPL